MKWYGKIGFVVTAEDPEGSGVWKEKIVERYYYGDINKMSRRWVNVSKVNDNFDINNEFSIVADAFAQRYFRTMRYIEMGGTYWKINNLEVEFPRILLTVGGEYNGETGSAADGTC